MRKLPFVFLGLLAVLLLFAVSGGGVGAQVAADASRIGANASVPPVPDGFGYGVNFGNPSGWNNKDLSTLAARAGADTVRIKLPEYHFDRWGYDIEFANGDMAAYQANGLTNMTGLLIGPTAAHSNSPNGGNLDQYSPRNLYQPIWSGPGVVNPSNYWAVYVHQVVSRYKGQVKIWEVWNEPDRTGNWSLTQGAWWSSPPQAADLPNWRDSIFAYIRLLRVTYEVAKSVDPNCFVAIGGIGYESFLDAVLRYTDNPSDGSVTAAYPARGGAWFDAVSYHHYPHYATYDQAKNTWLRGTDSDAMASSFLARQSTMRIQLERWGYDGSTYPRKIWLATESGVASKPAGGLVGGSDLHRNYMLKLPILAMAGGVSQVDWFQLADTEADGSAGSAYAHMGLYYDLRGQSVDSARLKPSAAAFKTYGAFLRGQRYDAAATASLELPAGVRGFVFFGADGRKSYALWAETSGNSESATATVQLPATSPLVERKWDFGLTQATRILNPSGGRVTVSLTSSPLFLTEGSGGGTLLTSTPVPTSTPTPTSTPAPTKTPVPTATATATLPAGGERLVNGGFESGMANWYLPSWFGGVVAADGSKTHSGSQAIRFQGSASRPYVYQEVPASAGDRVDFSGWINLPEVNGGMSMVVSLVPRHQYNGDLPSTTLATVDRATSAWVKIAGSAMMPDRTVAVRLKVHFPKLNGTAYLDDLSLRFGSATGAPSTPTAAPTAPPATPTPLPTATPAPSPVGNLLSNAGFEQDGNGDGDPDGWQITAPGGPVVSRSGLQHSEGSFSLLADSTRGESFVVYQDLPVKPGEVYDFSGKMNVPSRTGWFRAGLQMLALNSSGRALATATALSRTSATAGWVSGQTSLTVPQGATALRVQVKLEYLRAAVHVDGLSLMRTR